jgi:hypothetical protein
MPFLPPPLACSRLSLVFPLRPVLNPGNKCRLDDEVLTPQRGRLPLFTEMPRESSRELSDKKASKRSQGEEPLPPYLISSCLPY